LMYFSLFFIHYKIYKNINFYKIFKLLLLLTLSFFIILYDYFQTKLIMILIIMS